MSATNTNEIIKSYNLKYDLETRSKLREVQEYLEQTKSKSTLNDTIIFCISNTFSKIKEDEKNNLFNTSKQ